MNVIFDDMNTLSVEKKTHIKKKKTPTFAMASLIDSICLSNTVLRLFILCKYTWMYPVEMAMHVVRYFTIWNIIACLFFYQIFDTIFLCLLVSLVGMYITYVSPASFVILLPDNQLLVFDGLALKIFDIIFHHFLLIFSLYRHSFIIYSFRICLSVLFGFVYLFIYDTSAVYGVDVFEIIMIATCAFGLRILLDANYKFLQY